MSLPPNCVVKFTADWCGPCQAIAPFVEKLVNDNKLTLVVVDVDKDNHLSQEFEIKAMPTIVFIIDGKEKDRIVGANKTEISTKMLAFRSTLDDEKKKRNQIELPISEDANIRNVARSDGARNKKGQIERYA